MAFDFLAKDAAYGTITASGFDFFKFLISNCPDTAEFKIISHLLAHSSINVIFFSLFSITKLEA
jgi:hypothetical protein